MAASIWRKNREIAVGINQKKTHPIQKKFASNPDREYLHAEVDAIIRASRNVGDLRGCYLYVARSKEGSNRKIVPGISKPCDGCMECCIDFGLKGIYYTIDSESFGYINLN